MKKHTTNINEQAKSVLGISRDEYALCQYVQYRSADPRSKAKGYCTDTKDEIAEFVGITRRGIQKMIAKLEDERLLERSAKGWLCVTGRWIDAESECKQGSKDVRTKFTQTANKVHTNCEQSSHQAANKVHTHNKVKKDIKKEDIEGEREAQAPNSHPQPENEPAQFEAEKKDPIPFPVPPSQIPLDARAMAKTPGELVAAMRNFYIDRPTEWSDGVLQLAQGSQYSEQKMKDMMTAWSAHQITLNQGNNTFAQLNASFQKWVRNQKDFDRQYGKPAEAAAPTRNDNSKPLPAYVE